MTLTELTREIWNIYFCGGEQTNLDILTELVDPECVIIGTGKHEFYQSIEAFAQALSAEMSERKDIHFQFKDFWCEEKKLTADISLVYGGIYIWWESKDKRVCINMDSRFSILYQLTGEHWKIVHIHQSLPNMDQLEGEYYPKTLSEEIEKSRKKIETLSKLAQNDSLTGLINFRTFQEQYAVEPHENAWLFIMDLDDFKHINDTYGHLSGNHMLQKLSHILRSTFRSNDLICRLGGVEFVLLCKGLSSSNAARSLAQRLLDQVSACAKEEPAWTSLSIGMTAIRGNEPLDEAINRADSALYVAKASGKNQFRIAEGDVE